MWNYLHFKENVAFLYPLPFRTGIGTTAKHGLEGISGDHLVSLSVAGLRFYYSGHYQAEPQFFPSKKIPPLL